MNTPLARFIWRRKSRSGRPAVPRKMQALIRRLSRENPLWGAERIREELEKVKYEPPCEDSIRKYMVKPDKPRKPSGTWLPFLRNHLDVAWAMDLFTVTTLAFRTVYVFVILEHGRRVVRHWATTRNPTMQWVIQQLRYAMPYGEQPRFMPGALAPDQRRALARPAPGQRRHLRRWSAGVPRELRH